MKIITEQNISKIIIYLFIIIMSIMIFFISYFFVKNSYKDFENDIKVFEKEYYENQKNIIKREVEIAIDIINYMSTKSDDQDEDVEVKKDIIRLMHNISFQQKKNNYLFIYEVKDFNGGDNFAQMIVNPNRVDLLGSMLSTNYKDADGQKFREKFLDDIKRYGYSFTQYSYKKPNSLDGVQQKLSYFKLYEKWNWIVASGVYIDDIENVIAKKRENMKQKLYKEITQTLFLFLIFLAFAIVLSILVSQRIDEVLKEYKAKVKTHEDELMELNKTLENRVKTELEKNREQEQILIQKSKFIALGEMISNIAHQWRQPLSELSSVLMSLKLKHQFNKLDNQTMDEKSKDAERLIEYMSHTIDDFKDFFSPKKEINEFKLYKAFEDILFILDGTLKSSNIQIINDVDKSIEIKTYQNELEQVLLNIISNARDILTLREVENGYIKIASKIEDESIIITVEDNGGGIKVEPISKIYEPYFTTKFSSNGTGIGLYMSKIIIEKNIKGKLRAYNGEKGAVFEITLFKK